MSTTAEHHLLNRFADVSAENWIVFTIKIAIRRTCMPISQISLHNLPSHDARPSITDAVLGQVVKTIAARLQYRHRNISFVTGFFTLPTEGDASHKCNHESACLFRAYSE